MNRLIFLFIFLIVSCSSKRDIVYLQGTSDIYSDYKDYLINVDDILKIDVVSDVPEIVAQFNPDIQSSVQMNKDIMILNGYQVNSQGFIFFPGIGQIKVVGLTIMQLQKQIDNFLVDGGYLKNPIIDIKILNSHFTILGEVNNPGRYEFLKNNLNIMEAIGMAGDLTITGKRNDVRIIRADKIMQADLTSSNIKSNQIWQIFSGDVIIINPNRTKIKNAGIIGNSGTLLSLLSFILSSIIVINN